MDDNKPRLCHLRKWPDFNGYGFNLHAEKGKAGQYIGSVDENSPAQAAGLKLGDRIVEVNGVNIGSENHQQVVQRIKLIPTETRLLVVDRETDTYLKSHNIVATSDSPDVVYLEAPIINPYTGAGIEEEEEDGRADFTSSSFMNTTSNESPEEPPRLCILRRWQDFEGYGFNLHSEKGKPGQFIGKVDDKSPAQSAGLKKGDWIVEINGENVTNDLHHDVVAKIKSRPNEVSMLVVDSATDKFYKERGIVVYQHMTNVERIECPSYNPHTGMPGFSDNLNGSKSNYSDEGKRISSNASDNGSLTASQNDEHNDRPDGDSGKASGLYNSQPSHTSYGSTSSYGTTAMEKTAHTTGYGSVSSDNSTGRGSLNSVETLPRGDTVIDGLSFPGSVREARERMKKKTNVKNSGMTAKDKHDLLMNL